MKIQLLVSVIFFVTEVYSYSSFIQNCLDAHNAIRTQYGVPTLNWSADIAVHAQKWANHLAAIDQLQHDSTTKDGENLFYMYGGDPEQACDRAVKNWYQEVKNYDYKSPHLDDSTNHFSQLVWRSSTELGIGTAQSKSGNFFLVARYSPRGNIDGQFNDNVPNVGERASNENNQETEENNNLANITPAQDESSPSKPNVIYFKEINIDPTANGSENMAKPNPFPHQQAGVQYEPSERPAVESGREPETSYSSSRPETQESQSTPPSDDVTKQETSPAQEETSPAQEEPSQAQEGPSPTQEELSSPQQVFNERPNYKEDRETNKTPSPSEPSESSAHSVPLYEGSDQMQSRPFYPESESVDMKARPTETKTRPGPERSSNVKEEMDAALEKISQLPEHDEVSKKLHEPPKKLHEPKKMLHEPAASLTYVVPLVPKPPPKKPAPVPLKLPPALALITPKKGKDFRVAIRFTQMKYSSQMQVPGSLAFEEAKSNITSAIMNLFDEDDKFQEVQLISLRNGSVIATLGLLFAEDAPGNLDPLTRALLAGKIGNIPVAFKYESAVALPAGYLKPNRPLQERPPTGVCAQPCSQPNECYPTGCTAQCCAFHSHRYHRPALPSALPTCPGTCDDSCFPDCDDDCCSGMSNMIQAPNTGAVAPVAVPRPSITCPGSCSFACYPQCSPQCCSSQLVPNPCHASCPVYCAPSCDNACCAAVRKSAVNSLSKQYSRYRSAQRALARRLYLQKRLRLQKLRRLKSLKRARPVHPRQRSFYPGRARTKPENLGLDEDHSINEWAKKGEVSRYIAKAEYGSGN